MCLSAEAGSDAGGLDKHVLSEDEKKTQEWAAGQEAKAYAQAVDAQGRYPHERYVAMRQASVGVCGTERQAS